MPIPSFSDFILGADVGNMPTGETGQLTRLDNDHVLLHFDKYPNEDLVFDIHDTEPSIWAAILPVPATTPCSLEPSAALVATVALVLDALLGNKFLHTE